MGLAYLIKQDLREALEKFESCLQIVTKAGGDNRSNIAIILNNIGSIYLDMGRYK